MSLRRLTGTQKYLPGAAHLLEPRRVGQRLVHEALPPLVLLAEEGVPDGHPRLGPGVAVLPPPLRVHLLLPGPTVGGLVPVGVTPGLRVYARVCVYVSVWTRVFTCVCASSPSWTDGR